MSDKDIINELKELQTWAQGVAERANKLISKMEGVSTPSIARKGLSDEQVAKIKAGVRKRAYK
jgi:hypothetical protein